MRSLASSPAGLAFVGDLRPMLDDGEDRLDRIRCAQVDSVLGKT
jgi:hypothetical protein